MQNQLELKKELEYIHLNFDFSDDCSITLKNYILKQRLAYYDAEDILFLSDTGEDVIGYDGPKWSEEDDETEGFFYQTEFENE